MFDLDADLASVLADELDALPAREAAALAGGEDLLGRMFRAWERMDAFELIAVGRALERRGELADKHRTRFAIALTAFGFAEEAVQALGRATEQKHPHLLARRAAALAVVGRFGEAEAAAGEALAGLAGFADARDTLRLARLARKNLGRAGSDWEVADRLMPVLLALNARAPAAALARRALAEGPAVTAETCGRAAGLGLKALPLLPAAELGPLVQALAGRFGERPDVRALRLKWLVRMGRGAEAAELAAGLDAGADRDLAIAAAEAFESAGDIGAATALLAPLAAGDRADREARVWLAYCTGRLALTPEPAWAEPRPARTIALFPFYNELTILKIRLREMAPFVDQFVLVEAGQTFTGAPKPYYFDAFQSQVAEFAPKIVRARLPAFPPACDHLWAREYFQRDVAVTALDGLWRPDDRLLVTDVDEIVDGRALEGLEAPLASLRMRVHRYFFNYCARPGTPDSNRRSGFVCRAQVLRRFGSSYTRIGLLDHLHEWFGAPGAGWHLTSIGDAEFISDKFRNFSHQETGKAALRDAGQTAERLQAMRAGLHEEAWERRELDDSFPLYVREHAEELGGFMLD
jgi:hypothetical protein